VSRGQRDGSLPSYSRISRPEPLFLLPSSSSVVLTRLSGPRLHAIITCRYRNSAANSELKRLSEASSSRRGNNVDIHIEIMTFKVLHLKLNSSCRGLEAVADFAECGHEISDSATGWKIHAQLNSHCTEKKYGSSLYAQYLSYVICSTVIYYYSKVRVVCTCAVRSRGYIYIYISVPRGQRDGSLRPYSSLSRKEQLLFFQVSLQLYS
jgi:hypothetical protein